MDLFLNGDFDRYIEFEGNNDYDFDSEANPARAAVVSLTEPGPYVVSVANNDTAADLPTTYSIRTACFSQVTCGDVVPGLLEDGDFDYYEDGTRTDFFYMEVAEGEAPLLFFAGNFDPYIEAFHVDSEADYFATAGGPGQPAVMKLAAPGLWKIYVSNQYPTALPQPYLFRVECPDAVGCSETVTGGLDSVDLVFFGMPIDLYSSAVDSNTTVTVKLSGDFDKLLFWSDESLNITMTPPVAANEDAVMVIGPAIASGDVYIGPAATNPADIPATYTMSLICQTQLTCGETFNGTLFDGDDQDHWPGYLTDHFAYQQALGIESTITVSAAYDKRLEVTGPGGTTVHTADANGDIVAVRSGEGAFELALSNNGVILDDGSYSIKVSCAAVTPVPTTPPPTTIPPTTTVDPTTTTIPTTAPPTTAPPTTIPPTTTVDPTSTTIPTTAPPTATPSPTPVAQVDTDRDGLFNDDEGTRGTNPNNRDTDGDGWEDGLEVAIGTDPLDPTSPADDTDADDDGIPDSFDHDPTSGDSDGDGFRDFFELAWGSDPNDPNSIPGLGDVTNDGVPDNVDAVAIIEFFLERLTMDFPDYFGDLNRDGVVDNVDAVILFNWYVGNIALLPLDRP